MNTTNQNEVPPPNDETENPVTCANRITGHSDGTVNTPTITTATATSTRNQTVWRAGFEIKTLRIKDIVAGPATQSRKINQELLAVYKDAIDTNAEFPPVTVFQEDGVYRLADGYHRLYAAKARKCTTIECEIRKGSEDDAVRFAVGSNCTHGGRMTNEDKRSAVLLAVKRWPDLASTVIAGYCCVSHTLVDNIRNAQTPTAGSASKPTTRKGKDKKERRMPTKARKAPAKASNEENEPKLRYGLMLAQNAVQELRNIPLNDEELGQAVGHVRRQLDDMLKQSVPTTGPIKIDLDGPSSTGLMWARNALVELDKISDDDSQKNEGFHLVSSYIAERQDRFAAAA